MAAKAMYSTMRRGSEGRDDVVHAAVRTLCSYVEEFFTRSIIRKKVGRAGAWKTIAGCESSIKRWSTYIQKDFGLRSSLHLRLNGTVLSS